MNKKADGGLTAIVIILIALVFLGWIINTGRRECDTNGDCDDAQYCGSDFACHDIPKTIVYKQSLVLPLLFICLTIIALAVIWKWEVIFSKKFEKTVTVEEKTKNKEEPYYTSQFQYTAK
ncbi:MAG TPA: hypothetical protein VFF28_02160 [Candidatus Nanoarchaeia archaeon]|nr:hypothetical protein [Candidatus Nanoarchaeia archaeon]